MTRKDARGAVALGYGVRTMHKDAQIRALVTGYRPTVADIVGCLFCDSGGIEAGTDFREWIEEYGMGGEGHPADLLESFEACKKAARFVRGAFGSSFDTVARYAQGL